MTLTHPRLRTAWRIIAKIEATTSVRFSVSPGKWRYEQLHGIQSRSAKGEWRWRLTCESFGLTIASTHRVPDILAAYRLTVVLGDGTVEIEIDTPAARMPR